MSKLEFTENEIEEFLVQHFSDEHHWAEVAEAFARFMDGKLEDARQAGYRDGEGIGREEGYDDGYAHGYETGHDDGFERGQESAE